MTLTIWKLPLVGRPGDTFAYDMRRGAKVLHVALQNDVPTVWFLCDPDAPIEARVFTVVGTGWTWNDSFAENDYIGTVIDAGGFVWHIFEVKQ